MAYVDPADRWRPDDPTGPPCAAVWDGAECHQSGAHHCVPRADRAVGFFPTILAHTKGRWSRTPFRLDGWQEHEIIRPLFGEVVWSSEAQRYVRRYRMVYIVLGRKNGKSEIVAGIVLLMLAGDDEDGAEVYGAAKDTKQAGKVGDVVVQMQDKSRTLSKRLKWNKNARRLVDEKTASYFEVISADAEGELGHNPHAFYIDELLSQRDDALYRALRTAMGARDQPLGLLVTTETNQPYGFGATEIDEAERIQEDPSRSPHTFAYVRKAPKNDDELQRLWRLFPDHPDLPVSTDLFDERNWKWPNPALDVFLSREALRNEALEAQATPSKESSFRQFRLNQRESAASRFVPLDLWNRCRSETWPRADYRMSKLSGRRCWAGLDLSSTVDMTSWCLLFEDGTVWWRHWTTEDMMDDLDSWTSDAASRWRKAGWLTVCDGSEIDHDRVTEDIVSDVGRFKVQRITYDRWSMPPIRKQVGSRTRTKMVELTTTYDSMTAPLSELERLLKAGGLDTLGNPVADWMASALEVKRDGDRMRPVKPERASTRTRIDGMVTLLNAIDGRMRRPATERRRVRGKAV